MFILFPSHLAKEARSILPAIYLKGGLAGPRLEVLARTDNCILYQKEHQDAVRCPRCKRSRYRRNNDCDADDGVKNTKKGRKKKRSSIAEDSDDSKVPTLVMWYLPVVDRIRRLFANPRDATMMTWHARKGDGKLRHPADGTQ